MYILQTRTSVAFSIPINPKLLVHGYFFELSGNTTSLVEKYMYAVSTSLAIWRRYFPEANRDCHSTLHNILSFPTYKLRILERSKVIEF